MKLMYENQGTITYLSCEITSEQIDTMSLGMITNNRIPGLAAATFTQVDTQKFIKYNISSTVILRQYFSGTITRNRLLNVFGSIVETFITAENYMIESKSILLDLDQIYVDVSTGTVTMICVPILELDENSTDFSMFFKNILFTTQFDSSENCDYVAELINYLNSTAGYNSIGFSLTSFKEMINRLSENADILREVKGMGLSRNPEPKSQVVKSQMLEEQPGVQAIDKQMQLPEIGQATIMQAPKSMPSAKQQPISESVSVDIPAKPNQGMMIPGQSGNNIIPKSNNVEHQEEISLFYLLQHYNKENAAVYKAQKEAKKGGADKKNKTSKKAEVPSAPNVSIPSQLQPVDSTAVFPALNDRIVAVAEEASKSPHTAVNSNEANFGETAVLDKIVIGETTVLNWSQQSIIVTPFLIRMKTQEQILLNKPIFRIGKERSYVDYFIGDNTAISRNHANFIIRDGQYFVVDTNSTNHTYVNGNIIQSNVETKISHGDKIRLANEDFEFRLY